MEALGLVETNGLLAAIEASDTMLKAAEVSLESKTLVGGGLVTVTVVGDVAAVKSAVDAAAAAVNKLGTELLLSTHVIARPAEHLNSLIEEDEVSSKKKQDEVKEEVRETLIKETEEELEKDVAKYDKEYLSAMKMVDLRKFAKNIPNFPMSNKEIHKLNKTKLVEVLLHYFGND